MATTNPTAQEAKNEKIILQENQATQLYLCDGKAYKIRVQRPASCDWRNKRLADPVLTEYKALRRDIDRLTASAKDMEDYLAQTHPRCMQHKFVIAYLK